MKADNHSRNLESLVLKTKISIPRIHSEFVHRPLLTELIDRGVQGPLTLICAPAGFGKTHLLVEWTKKTRISVAWLSLDLEDNDLTRFARYLIGALQTLDPHLGEEFLDFVESTRGSGLEVGAPLLINDLTAFSKEIVLVLDDFQVLENSTLLQRSDFFIKHIPDNLHIIIASRSEPALELALLRARGRVVDLGIEDLRFTGEEVGQFFREAMGLQLPPRTIQVLEKRTDGWVTGLQMAAISLRQRPDSTNLLSNIKGPAHYLIDFLAEEVLDKQPDEIRQFLLKSSILDRLSGPLCEAVVNPQAQPGFGTVMLTRLEQANLFITALDERHDWFRYHPLFADFLRHIHQEINPGEIPILQKRASEWFEQNGDLDEAFHYALDSKDVEWAADLIERSTQTLIATGAIFPLTHSIGQLPDAVIHERPVIGLAYAWGLIALNRLDLARYWLDDVRRRLSELEKLPSGTFSVGSPQAGNEKIGLWNIRGGLAVCESALAVLSGDLEQAAEYSKIAASSLEEENPFIQSLIALDNSIYFLLSGDTQKGIESLRETMRIARQANNLIVMIIANCQLAYTQTMQGRLSQAWATLQKAQYIAMGPDGKPLPLAGLVDIGLGEILLERGALEEANAYLERGCQNVQSMWSLGSLEGLLFLARLRQAQGDRAGAQAVLSEVSQLTSSNESSQWDSKVLSAVGVRLALDADDMAEAEQWWIKGELPEFMERIPIEAYPYYVFEYLQLMQAKFLIRKGQDTGNEDALQFASELLEMLLLEAKRLQRGTSQIEILLLLAQVQAALQDKQAANTLLQALALGEPEGYWQIYIDEGWHLSTLLAECLTLQQGSDRYLPSPAFIQRLSAALPQPVDRLLSFRQPVEQHSGPITTRLEDGLPITLSAREMEVLKLIAEGKSNQEISAELYLALNTVKRHAYNIFAKLEVRKRTQAVSKARQLDLIP